MPYVVCCKILLQERRFLLIRNTKYFTVMRSPQQAVMTYRRSVRYDKAAFVVTASAFDEQSSKPTNYYHRSFSTVVKRGAFGIVIRMETLYCVALCQIVH